MMRAMLAWLLFAVCGFAQLDLDVSLVRVVESTGDVLSTNGRSYLVTDQVDPVLAAMIDTNTEGLEWVIVRHLGAGGKSQVLTEPMGDRFLLLDPKEGQYELQSRDDRGFPVFTYFELRGLPGPSPDPDPPSPDPPVPSVVPNDYHVGQIAYERAPVDAANAAKLAGVYRQAAGYLYGQPRLMTVYDASVWIKQQFDAKQCPSQEVCQQWSAWYAHVVEAINAEQRARGMFTRDDFYRAWVEVATALEAR